MAENFGLMFVDLYDSRTPPVPCGTGGFLKSRTDDQRRGTYI